MPIAVYSASQRIQISSCLSPQPPTPLLSSTAIYVGNISIKLRSSSTGWRIHLMLSWKSWRGEFKNSVSLFYSLSFFYIKSEHNPAISCWYCLCACILILNLSGTSAVTGLQRPESRLEHHRSSSSFHVGHQGEAHPSSMWCTYSEATVCLSLYYCTAIRIHRRRRYNSNEKENRVSWISYGVEEYIYLPWNFAIWLVNQPWYKSLLIQLIPLQILIAIIIIIIIIII